MQQGDAVCEYCGNSIKQIPKRKKKRFYSDECRNKWWNSHLDLVKRKAVYQYKCPNCGKDFEVYGNGHRNFYAFNSNGNKGIACGLNNLQKIKDGEPLGGKSRAEDDFATDADDDFLA